MSEKVTVGILGASGYTGAELVRLLDRHPQVEIVFLTADRRAGQSLDAVFPHLHGLDLPDMIRIDAADFGAVDAVFCALPHGTTQEVVAGLPAAVKVIDLSADFRLFDPAVYEQWYQRPHGATALQRQAVYGLTELHRDTIRTARLIANPGCYPTVAQLTLAPLLEAARISIEEIIIDAKSGVSGAGRAAKEATLFCEVSDGMHAYGVGAHRHAPEIEQGLSWAAGQPVMVNFTPHLVPMNRGILETIYVRGRDGNDAAALHATLAERYAREPFVTVLPYGQTPQTRHVRGSNQVMIGVVADRLPGRAILVGVEDNLVKGASGQAIQNFNLMFGLPETAGLGQNPLFP